MNIEKWIMRIKSWQTTALGIIAGLLVVLPQIQNLIDGNPATVFVWEFFATGLGMLGIGFFAKDGDKSSEDVGVR